MGRQQRLLHNLKKGEQMKEQEFGRLLSYAEVFTKRSKPKLISLLLFSLLSGCFIFAPHLLCFSPPSALSPLGSVKASDVHSHTLLSMPSTVSDEGMWCDRTGFRTDICFMKGDIRTHSPSSSILVYTGSQDRSDGFTNHASHEKIKPYTRKWEASVMDTITELNLERKDAKLGDGRTCDVHHDVPAVVFSTGGYTGNVYHEFNDGIIPLYITSQHFAKRVVFVISEYHKWWEMKYGDVVSQLSDYPLIDFSRDKRTHCFKEAIVGLRIHDELRVDPSLMQDNKTIIDFRNLLDRAYRPRINRLVREEELRLSTKAAKERKGPATGRLQRPKLVLLSRNGSRGIENEDMMMKMAKLIGFQVEVVRPESRTEMAKIYKVLNSSNVLVGVHGAAMTHFLFMRPGSVFVQIIPLGTDWPAETYYGEPAKKLGLDYIGYKILPRESSLYQKYGKDDPVLQDPSSINQKGWQFTKKIYLDDQQVKLELRRFKKVLLDAYAKAIMS
ncbi:PREDICTED: EGF domain-specific O-linked N-acetylglucosamine transferase-like [Tarenaya hassleriana]|uniref:EGF domain-specific O-linked N-acetylglucosamine transferase-like n=1 Tax=Tarenaya hassleriana TaxID=28532 RepID=UPI00053C8D12|nr:PREDICTED: EGF domain-specific O-linked N-acetylglucosamine transferase-like [Tarenaya hassleriana]